MEDTPPASLWRRLGWLVVFWTGGVAALAMLAWLLRQFMGALGLTA